MNRREAVVGILGAVSSLALNPRSLEAMVQEEVIIEIKPPAERMEELKQRLVNDWELRRAGITEEEILSYFSHKKFREHKYIERLFDRGGGSGTYTFDNYKRKHDFEQMKNLAKPFIEEHREDLLAAQEKYGLDARYIVATLAMESVFGTQDGRKDDKSKEYLVFNSLVSIYSYVNVLRTIYEDGFEQKKPKKVTWRDSFAYPNLKAMFLYAKRQNDLFQKDKDSIIFAPGSYAGCDGPMQFSQESLLHFFKGKKGTFNAEIFDIVDSIYAISNYYMNKGWNTEWNGKNHLQDQELTKKISAIIWEYNRSNYYIRAKMEIADSVVIGERTGQTLKTAASSFSQRGVNHDGSFVFT